ncbi:UNVERIFIED_CONTAM: hypothetical protein H355_008799, partial [Colinus virginianus]
SAIVLCLDVGVTMSSSAPGEESSLEQAKKVATKFLQRQVFAESKDEVAVVLFGTNGTKNDLASGDQYQNITVHRSLMLPDFDLLEDIQNKIKLGTQQADFLDAIIVCMDLLQKETLGKKFEKRHIELFTDLSSPVSEDQLEIIIANLKKTEFHFSFCNLPFPVDGADGYGDTSAGKHLQLHQNSLPRKGLTAQQRKGVDVVKKLMHTLDEEGGLEEIYTFRESLERLAMFKKIERRPVAWPCQLTIGSNLSIRIVAYKYLTEERVKKIWTVVDAKTLKKEDVQRETVYCLNDDDETEVQKDDTIQGFRYGSDIVPFSKEDEEQMKYKTEGKCFSVLGFSRSSQNAAVAFSALVQALDELNVVAIVRYAYDRRCNPQIGVAFPYIKDAYECLFYVQLPYMEDVRQYMFSSLKNNKKCTPSADQLSAIDSLIDSMNLVYEDDDGETLEDLFKPNKIPNPHFQRLYQDAGKKKEEKTAQDIFKDDEDGPSAKRQKIEDEEDSFSIMKLAEGNVTSTALCIGRDTKIVNEDIHLTVKLGIYLNVQVGSVNPAEDFRILVRQKNADFREANAMTVSQQLINRIDQFLENRSSQYYIKGINCIRVFREEAVKLSKVRCFNDFLQALKSKVEDKALADFWDTIVQGMIHFTFYPLYRISLITKDEAEGSSVTSEEAEKFLTPEEKKNETLPATDEGGDVDDLVSTVKTGCGFRTQF